MEILKGEIGEIMITGFTVRIDLGDMVLWFEIFASNPQSALEIVAKEKMSTSDHAMIDSEFLRKLSNAVVSEMPYCYSISNAQFEFDNKEIYVDVIKTWNTPEETPTGTSDPGVVSP